MTSPGPLIGRGGELDGQLLAARLGKHHGAAPHADAAPVAEAALDRVTEIAPVGLVDELGYVRHAFADGLLAQHAGQFLGGAVHVVDEALGIGRDDAFADRFERDLGLLLAAAERALDVLPVADVTRDAQDRALAPVIDDATGDLGPHPALLAVDELNLHPLRKDLAGQTLRHGIARHRPVRGPHQVRHRAADELLRRDAEHFRRDPVGEDDALAMHDHGLGHRVGEIGEQRLAFAYLPVSRLQRVEQPVDGFAKICELRRARRVVHALAEGGRLRDVQHVLLQCGQVLFVPAQREPQHQRDASEPDTGERQGSDQPDCRHRLHRKSLEARPCLVMMSSSCRSGWVRVTDHERRPGLAWWPRSGPVGHPGPALVFRLA